MMKKNAVIFDVDGTLWDSCQAVTNAWNTAISKYAPQQQISVTVERVRGFMGKTTEEIGAALFPDMAFEKMLSLMQQCGKEEEVEIAKNGGILFEDLENTLKILSQKYDLYIVSNCQAGYIEAFFGYHKLGHYFKDYENSGRTGKPKGENIQLILQRNPIAKALYIGDTQGDYEASKIAGIPFIYAEYGFGTVNASVPCAKSMKEIPALVESILQC